jgi:DNA-binding PadR family transcriptional regulator
MHRHEFKGGGLRGRHGKGWGPMRGHRHGMHGGWGWPGGERRRRMRRGDVRAAVLVLLDEGAMTGYGLMAEIERRSEGAWRPSPGSVYPTLALLEDEGLIRPQAGEGRTPYELTDEGRAHVEERREQLGEPWTKSAEGFGEGRLEVRSLVTQLAAASYQVAMAGDDAQLARAKEILTEARRSLYRILADEEPGETED